MYTPPEPAVDYLRVWRVIIVDFLGLDVSELHRLVDKWRPQMQDPGSLFYHEEPAYYISPLLIPRLLQESLDDQQWLRLCYAIYPIVVRYDRTFGLEPSCFPALRREIEMKITSVTSEWK